MFRGTKLVLNGAAKIGARPIGRSPLALAKPATRALSFHSAAPVASPIAQGRLQPAPAASASQLRLYGTTASSRISEEPARVINYDDMKKLVANHDSNVVLVDVREPSEYEQGHIGDAVNIPFKSMPGALGLDAAEFESTLGFPKPSTDKTLVFYCLGGIRSSSSEQLASTYGYKHRMNYSGSYQDWVNHENGAAQEPVKPAETKENK